MPHASSDHLQMDHPVTWAVFKSCAKPRCKDDGQSTDVSRESKGEMAELAWRAPFHVKPQKQPKISNSLKNKLLARLSCSLTLSTGRQRQEGLWFI